MNEERKTAVVNGAFSVGGGTARRMTLDVTGLSVDEIALKLENEATGPSLCHQCTSECEDPELTELVGLIVDGVEYVPDDHGKWTEYKP